MNSGKSNAFWWPIVFGAALIVAGFIIQVPGGALTTYNFLNGASAEDYSFDDKYSTVDEYVGGDAYNYIIGAELVAGKMAGTMISKTICFVSGAICICVGLTLSAAKRTSEENGTISTADPATVGTSNTANLNDHIELPDL